MPRPSPILPLVLAALMLAACDMPDFRARSSAPPPPAPLAPAPVEPGLNPGQPSAAEAACLAAGRERGFEVQGVVGSSEVMGADGRPASRDVLMRVARGQQIFDLRCNYDYGGAMARVMAL